MYSDTSCIFYASNTLNEHCGPNVFNTNIANQFLCSLIKILVDESLVKQSRITSTSGQNTGQECTKILSVLVMTVKNQCPFGNRQKKTYGDNDLSVTNAFAHVGLIILDAKLKLHCLLNEFAFHR